MGTREKGGGRIFQAGRRVCAEAQKSEDACVFRDGKQNGQGDGEWDGRKQEMPGTDHRDTGETG